MRAAVLSLALFVAARAHAATPLCLAVHADADEDGFGKLVRDELGHHPSHVLVDEGCLSTLDVELFTVAQTRYLTARVGREVPVRFAVKNPRDLGDRLSEALRQVLRHDPVYLAEDLPRMNAVLRAATQLVRRGTNRYRLSLFEVAGSGGRNPVFASGAAFEVTRGVEHVLLWARVGAAGSPHGLSVGDVALRVLVGADLGVVWEASARASTTFYAGAGVGLYFARFEGSLDGQPAAPVNAPLFALVARAGVRFLRFSAAELDLYAEAHLPLHKTTDPDSRLVDGYTPYGVAGVGVGF